MYLMNFCHIFSEWQQEICSKQLPPKTRKELCINQETFEGLTITGMSFLYTITKYDLYMYIFKYCPSVSWVQSYLTVAIIFLLKFCFQDPLEQFFSAVP